MKITSSGIENGLILDKYGKRGTQMNENDIPTYSLPFKIEDAPNLTKSYAIVLEDKDAIPVSGGFAWIHWSVANITRSELKDNESQNAVDFIQGVNSWTSMQGGEQSKELSTFYGGMCPPNAPHEYELHVFALDCVLELANGYYVNDLYHAMKGHVLEEGILYGVYND